MRWYNRLQDVRVRIGGILSKVSEKLVRITQAVKSAMESHAIAARPAECCGLLSGQNGLITGLHQLRNEADKPEVRYFASPEDLFAAMKRIRASSQKLIGIYHSHPRSPAYPSVADVQMAFYSEAVYFIISLEPRIEMRAFRIEGNKIDNLDMIIVEE